ncbi:MAG: hypothetical protein K2Q09_02170 [Phycisphaerales bacterium]|nr:hypothetical protein [Phycisphaerales bacterium]
MLGPASGRSISAPDAMFRAAAERPWAPARPQTAFGAWPPPVLARAAEARGSGRRGAQRVGQARARRGRADVLKQDDWIEKHLPGM